MNLFDKWIEALRSNEYLQTTGCLSVNDSYDGPMFCCLGVLCDITPNVEWSNSGPNRDDGTIWVDRDNGEAPRAIWEEMWLEAGVTRFPTQGRFAEMNDEGQSFKSIADEAERLRAMRL